MASSNRATERAPNERKLSEEQATAEEEKAKEEDEEERRQQEEEIGEIKRLNHESEMTQDQLDMVTKELEKAHKELYAGRLDEEMDSRTTTKKFAFTQDCQNGDFC